MIKIARKWKLVIAITAALTLTAALCTILFLSPDVQAEPSNDTTAPTAPLPVKVHATAEVGCEITGQLFTLEDGSTPSILTQLTETQLHTVGEYNVQLALDGKSYTATLSLVDTTAPTGTGVNDEIFAGSVPAPENFVTDIQDMSEVTISADTLDTSVPGTVDWKITLTDAYGNTGSVTVILTVVPDTEAPKFSGLKKITIELGESVSYKSGVSVTDNCDGAITTYTVNKSAVDTTQPGTYTILYTAVDKAGNQVTAERTLVIEPKPVITKELVESVVAELIDKLTDDSMSVNKKFELAYDYIRKNVTYKNIVEEDLYTAAYYAIKKSRGDCFNYYACITVICDYLGIENMGITRSASSATSHYWSLVNLGTGWYHVDACPTIREYNKRCFMWTDKQCEDYNKSRTDGRTDYYAFDAALYPERATEKYKP